MKSLAISKFGFTFLLGGSIFWLLWVLTVMKVPEAGTAGMNFFSFILGSMGGILNVLVTKQMRENHFRWQLGVLIVGIVIVALLTIQPVQTDTQTAPPLGICVISIIIAIMPITRVLVFAEV